MTAIPQSPLKRIARMQQEEHVAKVVPDSPEMKMARSRLGNLLSGIRDTDSGDAYAFDGDDVGVTGSRRQLFAGRNDSGSGINIVAGPRRKRERRVVFELRSKPFELQDRAREMSLYELCRLWVKGRDDGTDPMPPDTTELHRATALVDDARLDLLATKDIHVLPGRDTGVAELPPVAVVRAPPVATSDDHTQLMHAYKQRWKCVKEQHVRHSLERQNPFSKSLALLETVFSIAQENQVV